MCVKWLLKVCINVACSFLEDFIFLINSRTMDFKGDRAAEALLVNLFHLFGIQNTYLKCG